MVVIDSEFTYVGPIAFDVGLLLGNIFLGMFGQELHPNETEKRKGIFLVCGCFFFMSVDFTKNTHKKIFHTLLKKKKDYKKYLGEQAIDVWHNFAKTFQMLWDNNDTDIGNLFPKVTQK